MAQRLITVIALLFVITSATAQQENRWKIENHEIVWEVNDSDIPHRDHLEMSGQYISTVLRWGVEADGSFYEERSLVFPMLRTIPNDTHASLMHRIATDVPSLISVNGKTLTKERVQKVSIHGAVTVESIFTLSNHENGDDIKLTRCYFPSTTLPAACEIYTIMNLGSRNITVYLPDFHQEFKTIAERGVDGSYLICTDLQGPVTTILGPNETLNFDIVFTGRRATEAPLTVNAEEEYSNRMEFVSRDIEAALVLETPDPVINTEFQYAKLRASESIYKTKGGFMHGPGGESYYAALWANDQAEYVNPFFPYLGYSIGNESAFNAYMHFARFMNDEYKPIPSSIIAEGIDIWDGAGDRGDAAMIAYGASRYALTRADRKEAEQLWPLITWCLEYCRRQLNEQGVVRSDSDELEGRFESGDANLCTSSLYYDALQSAVFLGKALKKENSLLSTYAKQAVSLKESIESYFGKDLYGYHTYQYYEGNDLLRSWICIPLTVGIFDRAQGTLDALFSDKLWHDDGLLTEQGSTTYWDRSTLYALRGAYAAGDVERATEYLHYYSNRRLLQDHVPYPIEAYPEGSQRHLSAESGLYCRIITEGLFGIRPTGFNSFQLTPRLPQEWDKMTLRHVKAFGKDFDITISRKDNKKLTVEIDGKTYTVKEGKSVNITLGR